MDLQHLQRLTRDYARLSSDSAGSARALAGTFLILVGLLESWGRGWHLGALGAYAPLPLPRMLGMVALPLLWLLVRALLGRWTSRRFGAVTALPVPSPCRERFRSRMGRTVLPLLILALISLVWLRGTDHALLRTGLLALLAQGLSRSFPAWTGRVERMTGILLFLAAAASASGFQLSGPDALLAYPLMGLMALQKGLREVLAFRRLRTELTGTAA
nr:hypothetical protein [uncultured Holophaga sp.]